MNFDIGDDGIAELDEFFQVAQNPQPHTVPIHSNAPEIGAASASPSLAGTIKSIDFEAAAHASSHSPPVELAVQHAHEEPILPENNGATSKRAKRARPLLDTRTELTDEEINVSVNNSPCLRYKLRASGGHSHVLSGQTKHHSMRARVQEIRKKARRSYS